MRSIWLRKTCQDPQTDLYYYRARYYSSKLGRFLQTDPIGARDDLNLYAYTYNDSLNRIDPTGATWDDFLTGFGLGNAEFLGNDISEAVASAEIQNQSHYDLGRGLAILGNQLAPSGGPRGGGAHRMRPVVSSVHGNSNSSKRAQHGYTIRDTQTKNPAGEPDAVKTGISGQTLAQDGSSPRANPQANQLNREVGEAGRFKPEVERTNMPNRAAPDTRG